MPRARCGDVELEYEVSGSGDDPTLVLIMGFTAQLVDWDDGFVGALVDAGFRVVRFDNRDAGLSSDVGGEPDLAAILDGDLSTVGYTLPDMADDVTGLMDALGVGKAHLLGVSLGGMIAQIVAVNHPDRTSSLCSIMSCPGDRRFIAPDPAVLAALARPAPCSADDAAAAAVDAARLSMSPVHLDEGRIAAKARLAFERAQHPMGTQRQIAAILATAPWADRLVEVVVPTLVIHGADDPMIVPDGGRATADAIPDASFLLFEDMGHELPEPYWDEIVREVAHNADIDRVAPREQCGGTSE